MNEKIMTDAEVSLIVADFVERGIVPADAQAMALVKRFDLELDRGSYPDYTISAFTLINGSDGWTEDASLNRAIVRCVAIRWPTEPDTRTGPQDKANAE